MARTAIIAVALVQGAVGCGTGGESSPAVSTSALTVGSCVRDPAKFDVDQTCTTDASCECGSHCDEATKLCTFECVPDTMPPFPAEHGVAAPCAAGLTCDDGGRCVGPNGYSPAVTPILSADPVALSVQPGPAGSPLTVTLRLANASDDARAAGAATVVRVLGADGVEVACGGGGFGGECELAGWTFGDDGTATLAAAARWAEGADVATAGTVRLAIDNTSEQVVIPALLAMPSTGDGVYAGVIASADAPSGVPVTARVKNGVVVVRDATRAFAPDGALVLDLRTSATTAATRRRITWLRAPGAGSDAAGIVGDYGAGVATIDADTRTLDIPFDIAVPGTTGLDELHLQLTRTADFAPECGDTLPCGAGDMCAPNVGTCVPQTVWTPTTAAIGNALEDPRSAAWWSAVSPLITSAPAFATDRADLVESVLCSVNEQAAGRLGAIEARLGSAASRSGDLACIDAASLQPNGAPGAVGMLTLADRGFPDDVKADALFATCLADLARAPAAGFAGMLGPNVGQCVNLARALPAFRLLASNELGRTTRAQEDLRTRGLLVRLTQQWAMLQGFIASVGLSKEDYQESTTTPPAPSEARVALGNVIDQVDAGFAALLDQRVQPAVHFAVGAPIDYRYVKRPDVYWPFNATDWGNFFDIIYQHFLQFPFAWPPVDDDPCAQDRVSGNSWMFKWGCDPANATFYGPDPAQNLTVTMNVDTLDGIVLATDLDESCYGRGCRPRPPEIVPPPYRGGTLLALPTLAVAETVDPVTNEPTMVVGHPVGAGVELVTFTGYHKLGKTSPSVGRPGKGTTFALVRDTTRKTYTLYVARPTGVFEMTKPYVQAPSGTFSFLDTSQMFLGGTMGVPDGHPWAPYRQTYAAVIDDVAIFASALSRTEVVRFATSRGIDETHRDVWPQDMNLVDSPTQEINAPTGALLLEAQAAELEVVARLTKQTDDLAQLACHGGPQSAAAARTELATLAARAGRTVRQSRLVEGLADADTSDRAAAARQLLAAKRVEIARGIGLTRCTRPFGLAEDEVPLYHGSLSPQADEGAAFFAASDHLLGLASEAANEAFDANELARARWDQARQSEIQQVQSDDARAIRLEEVTDKYGDAMRRLCGITGKTAEQIVASLMDPQQPFDVDMCFVNDTIECHADVGDPITEIDPTCYRGQIGASLLDMRTASFAYQSAFQSFEAARANAEAAERLCVWKEMDAFGCTAADREGLTGVACPPGHQGTLQLTKDYNQARNGWEKFHTYTSAISDFITAVSTANPAAILGASDLSMKYFLDKMERDHALVLAERAAQADIVACWNQAEQYSRAIASAGAAADQSLSQFQAASLGYANARAEADQLVLEAPVVVARERDRAVLPIAFHYWVPEYAARAERLLERARRYVYLALRAVEYDTQDSYVVERTGYPLRSAVLGATMADQLVDQVAKLRAQTVNHVPTSGKNPSLLHLTFDLGAQFFGLPEGSSELGQQLAAHLRPAYSTTGEYLGLAFRFSLVPRNDDEAPSRRCAERIWRVNVGAVNYPSQNSASMHLKLIKRNAFASRRCDGDGLRSATIRPESNLLVESGDAAAYQTPVGNSVADLSVMRLDAAGALDDFRYRDDAYNASSTELSAQGMYGDYVLLFPVAALQAGLVPQSLYDVNLRFDYLSVDDTPPLARRASGPAAPRIELDDDTAAITVE